MPKSNPVVQASKILCEDAKALGAASKITVEESKKALTRSHRMQAYIAQQRKFATQRGKSRKILQRSR